MTHGGLKSVVLWLVPNYVAILALVTLSIAGILPLDAQHTLEGWRMLFPLFLPISTLVAAVKALQLSLRAGGLTFHFWQPIAAWCLVMLALAFNAFSYMVISHALR
jgi:hypothetical protein